MPNQGWHDESQRHALASKGIKTADIVKKSTKEKNSVWNKRVIEKMKDLNTVPGDWAWTGQYRETRTRDGTPNGNCEICGHPGCADMYLMSSKNGHALWVGSECVNNMAGASLSAYDRARMDKLKEQSKIKSRFLKAGVPENEINDFSKKYDYNKNDNTINLRPRNYLGYANRVKLTPESYDIIQKPNFGTNVEELKENELKVYHAYIASNKKWATGKGQFINLYSGEDFAIRHTDDVPINKKVKIVARKEDWGNRHVWIALRVEEE